MSNTEVSELDRPLFFAAALRGFRLQRMPDDYYGLFKRNGDAVELVASGLTFKDVANRCGAFAPMGGQIPPPVGTSNSPT